MLVAYQLPWTLFFGSRFFLFLVSGTIAADAGPTLRVGENP